MLELVNIHKSYAPGSNEVRALQGVDLQFRRSEFVSILGPSGCGKTTLLNIIGGLDQYSRGDLIIDGVSTKNYGDREWDTYRNHSVGFVFQNYNLIPHQSVLANVEIALSLSGVGRKERRQRAKQALEQVGLGDQLRKKPSQMSGGQMQRVAIARALVNNPDIILADEPTGALDTGTSVQVMEILKEISKERLVIMVTHNPELAETYSTRIIRMLDGKITGDTMPLTGEEQEEFLANRKIGKLKKARKPSMSLLTSFSLSLKNLFTKKGRTILTAFAGSIGIIGIALIYAVSQGTTGYIQDVQEDTLASYPLTLESSTVDMGTLMETFMGTGEATGEHEKDGVYSHAVLFEMFNALNNLDSTKNDLQAFKLQIEKELENPESQLSTALSGVQYTYNFDLLVYTESVDGKIVFSDTQKLLMDALKKNMNTDFSAMSQMQDQMSSSMGMSMMSNQSMKLWNEMLSAKDGTLISPLLREQYDLVEGRWPHAYNEIILIVDENYELDDLTLFALGLKAQEEMDAVFEAVNQGTNIDTTQQKWSFQEIMAMEFRVVPNTQCYRYNQETGQYTDLRSNETGLRYLYDNGIPMKVVGILTPNPDSTSHMLRQGTIGYTRALTEYLVEQSQASEAVRLQIESPKTDILTGLPFGEERTLTEEEKAEKFREYVTMLEEGKQALLYVKIQSIPAPEVLEGAVANAMAIATPEIMQETAQQMLMQEMGVDAETALGYVNQMEQETLTELYQGVIMAQEYAKAAAIAEQQLGALPPAELSGRLKEEMTAYTTQQMAGYYDQVLEFSESTYEDNLEKLGYVQLDDPATINLYASSFENKEIIEDFIANYNKTVEELKQIRYTDYVGLILSGVTGIIDAITYVLIAFVAISLIVSSIMIGVITLISVQERTKEIGILRAIGASKGNVSSMFNAETVIIGFTSGLIGVGMTYLLCIPVNAIVQALTDIHNLRAYLPVPVALILVGISVLLTLLSGIIPSRSAAKKDPVVALRTE